MATTLQKQREDCRNYHSQNREAILVRKRAYYAANKIQHNLKGKKWREKNKNRVKENQKKWRDMNWKVSYLKTYGTPEGRIIALARGAIQRATKRKMPFDKIFLYSLAANPPTHCICCSQPFNFTSGRGRGERRDSPSLDRLDNDKGYVAGNVKVICFRCNDVKSDATIKELETVIFYMRAS